MIDRQRLQQVCFNLLSNAIKFSHQDQTVNVKLVVRKDQENFRVQISVVDHGVGLTVEHQKKLF